MTSFNSTLRFFRILAALSTYLIACHSGAKNIKHPPKALAQKPSSKQNAPQTPKIEVKLTPVIIDSFSRSRTQFGKLKLLAAYKLSSPMKRFGGFSSLAIDPKTKTLYTISDRGMLFITTLKHDSGGKKLIGLENWKAYPLRETNGSITKGLRRDAEAITRDQDGSLFISFEQDHRIVRYLKPGAKAQALSFLPPTIKKMPSNGGFEAMIMLKDHRILAFSEERYQKDGYIGWLISKDANQSICLKGDPDFRPTDLTQLHNGDILVLERAFSLLSGLRTRIRKIPHSELSTATKEKRCIRADLIYAFQKGERVDNFEGIAAEYHAPSKSSLIYLISDDNFNFFQATLLYQFVLQ